MSFPLPEKITVWNKATNDGLGGFTWNLPFVYEARTALKREKFTDANGDTRMSTGVAYSEGPQLKLDSRVLFGESLAIEPPANADDVRMVSQIPSGAGALKKVWLA